MSAPTPATHGSRDAGRARLAARLQRGAFSTLFLAAMALLAVLSERWTLAVDWTDSARNTLSAASAELLSRMPERIEVRAFVTRGDDRLREATRQLLGRYRRVHPELRLEFVDPQREPRIAERYRVRQQGELVVEYRDRRENVRGLSEALLSGALARLARGASGWAAWLETTGARDPRGDARPDLGRFTAHLESLGVSLGHLAPGQLGAVPDNVSLLVVPQPAGPLPAPARDALRRYLARGGNVLWLADPGAPAAALADPLGEALGVAPEPGLVVDPASRLDGRPTPEFVVVNGFAGHPVTEGLAPFVAFPTATSLAWEARDGWQVRGLAASGLRSWRETGDLGEAVRFDDGADSAGPLDVAVALERPHPRATGRQRAVVVGDVDFLSNAYLGLGANRALGVNAVNWLADAEHLIDVPSVMAPDLDYAPGQGARAVIALGAPVVLPLALLAFGLARWRRRRERT